MSAQFYKGESVLSSLEIRRTIGNALVDPTSVKITITLPKIKVTDSDIIKVNAEDMTKDSTGKYSYNWISDAVGNYFVTYTVMDASKKSIGKDSFNVIQ